MSSSNAPARPPMRRALVMGALSGRRISAPRRFLETLWATTDDCDIVIFCHDLNPDAGAYLRQSGVTIIPFSHWRPWHGPVHAWRFVLFARYAAEHHAKYDAILVSDLRDVLFQADPFATIEDDRRVRFFLENAAFTHETSLHYAKWLRIFARRSVRDALRDKRLSCCGVTLGGAAEMNAYLAGMEKWIRRVPPITRQRIGADSVAHNVAAWLDGEGVISENNDLVATMGLEPHGTYSINADGQIMLTAGGHVPPICHQYDRLPDLLAASRYAGR